MDPYISEFIQEEIEIEREEYRDTPAYNRFYNYYCEQVNPIYFDANATFMKNWCQVIGLGKEYSKIINGTTQQDMKDFVLVSFRLVHCWILSKDIKELRENVKKVLIDVDTSEKNRSNLVKLARFVLDRFDEYGVQLKIKNEYEIKA